MMTAMMFSSIACSSQPTSVMLGHAEALANVPYKMMCLETQGVFALRCAFSCLIVWWRGGSNLAYDCVLLYLALLSTRRHTCRQPDRANRRRERTHTHTSKRERGGRGKVCERESQQRLLDDTHKVTIKARKSPHRESHRRAHRMSSDTPR